MAKRAPAKSSETKAETPAPSSGPSFKVTMLGEVFGHDGVKRSLAVAASSERVHHAWIFHGPVGVGKFSTAVAFGAALLDPTMKVSREGAIAVDLESRVQRLVRSGNHPDVHIVNKELAAISENQKVRDGKQITLPVDVIREFLVRPAGKTRVLPPEEGTARADKVFIVDEAEMMNNQAQNAALKVLEEAPSGTVIILITSSEERLLPTIRSRCQRVAFLPLSDADMSRWLGSYAQRHAGVTVPSGAQREWLLKFAAGSPGVAQMAMEHDLFTWNTELAPMLDQSAAGRFNPGLGAAMAALVGARAEAAVKRDPQASKDAANKAWARRMLAYIAEDTRGRLRAIAAGKRPGVGAADGPLHVLDCVSEAEQHLASNVNMANVFENLAAQMSVEPAVR